MADIVFGFFRVSWHASRARGANFAQDRLATAFAAEGALIADVPRSVGGVALRMARTRHLDAQAPGPRYSPLAWRRRDPTDVATLRRAYGRYARGLERAVAAAGFTETHLITTNPFLAGLVDHPWAMTITWHATDDFSAAPAQAAWEKGYLHAYEGVREKAVRVSAVSSVLLDRLAPVGPARVVPNGVERSEWNGPQPAVPGRLAHLPRPLAVYIGGLDERVSINLVSKSVEGLDGGSVALIGPVLSEPHVRELAALRGVHVLPQVSRAHIGATVRSADIGLIPHARTRLTEAMSPLKVYEYLAAGLPVASVGLRPVADVASEYPGRILLANDPADFAATVHAALELGAAPEDQREEFLEAASWSARQKAIRELALGVGSPPYESSRENAGNE